MSDMAPQYEPLAAEAIEIDGNPADTCAIVSTLAD
jgi:hypothetical protein